MNPSFNVYSPIAIEVIGASHTGRSQGYRAFISAGVLANHRRYESAATTAHEKAGEDFLSKNYFANHWLFPSGSIHGYNSHEEGAAKCAV